MLSELSTLSPSSDYQHLKVRPLPHLPSVWTLEFEHGKANEVGVAVLDELEHLTEALNHAKGPVALISYAQRVSAKGTPLFISGANVTERSGWSDDDVKRHVRRQRTLLSALRAAPVFHVCVVHGVALGWGTEFLITADYKLATPTATFGLPETGLGILPGAGGTSELATLIGPAHALRLGMTGERISSEEALRVGLVQEGAPSLDEGLQRAVALCERVARNSPTAVAAFKRGLLASLGQPAEVRQELEAQAYERCVITGQAAIGRRDFALIRQGETPAWGPRQ
jgi:enoyl-CoA hydratase/carnithine racemase